MTPLGAAVTRDPVNRLYESASDLVEAATGLREAAPGRQTAPAHPAVLGCIELALGELGRAAAAMRAEDLEIALREAAAAASAARSLSARSPVGSGRLRAAGR